MCNDTKTGLVCFIFNCLPQALPCNLTFCVLSSGCARSGAGIDLGNLKLRKHPSAMVLNALGLTFAASALRLKILTWHCGSKGHRALLEFKRGNFQIAASNCRQGTGGLAYHQGVFRRVVISKKSVLVLVHDGADIHVPSGPATKLQNL